MSKTRLKLTLYTQADFNSASKLDRILMSEMEPNKFALLDLEEKYLGKIREAFVLVGEELQENVALKKIRERITGYESYSQASKLLNDTLQYYNNFIPKNRAYKLSLVISKLYGLAEKANEQAQTIEDFDAVSKMLERAARLEGLDKIQHGLNAADIQIGDVIITSNVKALQAEEKAEDDITE